MIENNLVGNITSEILGLLNLKEITIANHADNYEGNPLKTGNQIESFNFQNQQFLEIIEMPNINLKIAENWRQISTLKIVNFSGNKLTEIGDISGICGLEIIDFS